MTDKWIGNSKPWKPVPTIAKPRQTQEEEIEWAKALDRMYDELTAKCLKEEAEGANKVEVPDIIPKEPQWRPTDGEAFGGLEHGDWPGYLHADDFRP